MSIKLFPYKAGSRGAKELANALGARVLKRKNSKYRFREGDLVINWGARDCPFKGRGVANQPETIDAASNKLKCFQKMKEAGVSVPDFWTKPEDIPNDTFPIVCRTILNGHSGAGIVIANDRRGLVRAPLYTKYVKKKYEFRVHVLRKPGGETSIITTQRKAKRNGIDADFKVRNLANGFVYVDNDYFGVGLDKVHEEAKKALESVGLAFGAVDVIYNEHLDRAYVLEINTAPGLETRTAEAYAKEFLDIYREM